MISQTAVVKKADALGSSIPDLADNRRLGIISILLLIGLVRTDRGLAGSGHDCASQARGRSGSSLQDEPALRLADPGVERLRLS